MVWQQKTKALVILNRSVEKELVKCAQYWPTKGEGEMLLEETGLSVKFLSEDMKSYYTVHLLQLGTTSSGEARTVSQKQEELQSCRLWNKSHIHKKIDKMKRQRAMYKMKEQDKTQEKQLNEVEIGNLPEK